MADLTQRLTHKLDEKDAEMEQVGQRLKEKLDGKDLQMAQMIQKLKGRLDEKDERIAYLEQRLKEKLDEKDAQLAHLKRRLDQKDVKIRSLQETLETEEKHHIIVADHAGSIAEAAIQLNQVFEAAQAAADQYLNLKNWRKTGEKLKGG